METYKHMIGPSPVLNVLKFALLCLVGEGLLVLGMEWAGVDSTLGGMCLILIFVSLAVWIFLGPMLLGMFIAAAINQMGGYRAASKAIREGFSVSYVVRGGLCNGIIMVDERNKKLYVNGLVVPFTMVERIYSHGKSITVKLANSVGPENREKLAKLDTDSAAKTFGYRLQHSLGFSR